MAKNKEVTTQGRELRIRSCAECKGEPPEEPYSAQHFSGTKCSICWEILTIVKDGVPIELKEKKPRVTRQPKVKSKIEKPQLVYRILKAEIINDILLL